MLETRSRSRVPEAGTDQNPTKLQHFQTLDNTLFSSAKMQEQFEPLRNDLLLRAARGIYFIVR